MRRVIILYINPGGNFTEDPVTIFHYIGSLAWPIYKISTKDKIYNPRIILVKSNRSFGNKCSQFNNDILISYAAMFFSILEALYPN